MCSSAAPNSIMEPLEAISTEPDERGVGRRGEALGDGEAQVEGASEMPSGSMSDETRGGSDLRVAKKLTGRVMRVAAGGGPEGESAGS